MDIVLPLGKGSINNNLELRFCLRSIEKYVADVENVFIIGERPDFLRNTVHVSAIDMQGHEYKERNIFSKIMLACNDPRVSDDFLFFNDDHFLLRPWLADTFHHRETLKEMQFNRIVKDAYYKAICNTVAFIGGDAFNFDVHCPIVYNKERFKRTVGRADWYKKGGFLIKSVYCAMNGIVGSLVQDLKISKPFSPREIRLMLRDRPYFSCSDHGLNKPLRDYLHELFPNPSRYEG